MDPVEHPTILRLALGPEESADRIDHRGDQRQQAKGLVQSLVVVDAEEKIIDICFSIKMQTYKYK